MPKHPHHQIHHQPRWPIPKLDLKITTVPLKTPHNHKTQNTQKLKVPKKGADHTPPLNPRLISLWVHQTPKESNANPFAQKEHDNLAQLRKLCSKEDTQRHQSKRRVCVCVLLLPSKSYDALSKLTQYNPNQCWNGNIENNNNNVVN